VIDDVASGVSVNVAVPGPGTGVAVGCGAAVPGALGGETGAAGPVPPPPPQPDKKAKSANERARESNVRTHHPSKTELPGGLYATTTFPSRRSSVSPAVDYMVLASSPTRIAAGCTPRCTSLRVCRLTPNSFAKSEKR
jgi:hypothetical protein